MTVEPGWIPPETDTTKANIARVYDYWLGGDHNFQADRDVARTIIALDPNFRTAVPSCEHSTTLSLASRSTGR